MDMNGWIVLVCLVAGSILVGWETSWQLGLAAGLFAYAIMPDRT